MYYDSIYYTNFFRIDRAIIRFSYKNNILKEYRVLCSGRHTLRDARKNTAAFTCISVVHLTMDVFGLKSTAGSILSLDISHYSSHSRVPQQWPSNSPSRPLWFMCIFINNFVSSNIKISSTQHFLQSTYTSFRIICQIFLHALAVAYVNIYWPLEFVHHMSYILYF